MLENKIEGKSARIGVIGLGYVGLPLAVAFAKVGFPVVGFDYNEDRVKMVNASKSYISDVLDDELAKVHDRFLAIVSPLLIASMDVLCICVPTPLSKTKDPDLTYIIDAAKTIAAFANREMLIVVESTTYPGTTREQVLPLLEQTGRSLDKDFYLAFSPEMVDPGNKDYKIDNVPKVVGGLSRKSTDLASLLYSQVVREVIAVSSAEVAEMVKVFSNVFRNVNIALVNELALLCHRMKVSVWEVIDAAARKPFGYMPFYPGFVGGHCIPDDPYYLSQKARELDFHTRFIELSADVNEQMPYYVLCEIMRVLGTRGKTLRKAKVLVLGVAFKKDVADVRESGSVKLIELLKKHDAGVEYHDPYVPSIMIGGRKIESVDLHGTLPFSDCVIVATDHTCFDIEQIVSMSALVYDIRGATRHIGSTYNVVRLGE